MAPPPGASCFINCVKSTFIKLLGIVLCLTLVTAGHWYVYEYVQKEDHILKCSSDYPDLGVILDNAVTLDDGSVQTEDGTVYPPGAFWVEDGLVRGCPCVIGPCVRSCCPQGQTLSFWNCVNIDTLLSNEDKNGTLKVFSDNNPRQPVTVSKNHYFVTSEPSTECSRPIFDPPKYLLLDNGRIWNKYSRTYAKQHEFCFSTIDDLLINPEPEYCPTERNSFVEVHWYFVLKYSFLVLPMMIHVVTFFVFLLVPRLQSGSGLAIMNYVAAQFLKTFALLGLNSYKDITYFEETIFERMLNDMSKLYEKTTSTTISSMVQYNFDLSAHVWQLIIAYQIKSAFSGRQVPRTKHTSRIRRILYSCVAWGVSLVWIAVLVGIGYILREFLEADNFAVFLYKMIAIDYLVDGLKSLPLVLLEVVSLVFCVITACSLRAHQKDSARLQGPDSQRHNTADIKWSNLFWKLSLITGVDYIFLNVFNMIDNFNLWLSIENGTNLLPNLVIIPMFVRKTLYSINQVRGVEIFFIFVFKLDVWKYLREKLRLRKKLPNNNVSHQNRPRRPAGPSQPALN